jgi:hypothetical protein
VRANEISPTEGLPNAFSSGTAAIMLEIMGRSLGLEERRLFNYRLQEKKRTQ